MTGCGFTAHEQGDNPARNAVLLAGFDHHVPGGYGEPLLRIFAADDQDGIPRHHTVTEDEALRAGTTVEALSKLKPAFKPTGTVTAGNACPRNDGAAAVLVMSEEKGRERGVKPRARTTSSQSQAACAAKISIGRVALVSSVEQDRDWASSAGRGRD